MVVSEEKVPGQGFVDGLQAFVPGMVEMIPPSLFLGWCQEIGNPCKEVSQALSCVPSLSLGHLRSFALRPLALAPTS